MWTGITNYAACNLVLSFEAKVAACGMKCAAMIACLCMAGGYLSTVSSVEMFISIYSAVVCGLHSMQYTCTSQEIVILCNESFQKQNSTSNR